ncbi:MAG TPA: translation initiation factor IF-3 [bacterium]|nr:translation initiation factor IF-3 [bacterium]
MRVIDPDGNQVGILNRSKALEMAEESGLDLVEIAPNATPPVCRIMDYGKYKYQQSKKEKESRKKQHVIHVKEIRLRPTIDEHDIGFKMNQARKFIESGNHLRIRILFRGRQLAHPELGEAVLTRVKTELEEIAKLESPPIKEGRNIVATFVHK